MEWIPFDPPRIGPLGHLFGYLPTRRMSAVSRLAPPRFLLRSLRSEFADGEGRHELLTLPSSLQHRRQTHPYAYIYIYLFFLSEKGVSGRLVFIPVVVPKPVLCSLSLYALDQFFFFFLPRLTSI